LVIPTLKRQPLILQEEVLLGVLRDLGIEPTTQKVQACLELCDQPTGRSLDLSADWRILHDRDQLLLHRRTTVEPFAREITIGKEYDFGGFRFAARPLERVPDRFDHRDGTEVVDADRVGHMVLRAWRDGDWFVPLGMKGRKKVSDYFVNEKIPTFEKHTTPILESDGDIVWVCGHRLDQRFSISATTKRALELRFQRQQSSAHA
jgi:tRNA(Ile)-lysidine synthase